MVVRIKMLLLVKVYYKTMVMRREAIPKRDFGFKTEVQERVHNILKSFYVGFETI